MSWPSRKMSASTSHGVADAALGRVAAAVDGGGRVLDARCARAARCESGRARQPRSIAWEPPDKPRRARQRRPAPPHLAARWSARERGVSLRRLARAGGPVLVAGAAARAARSLRLAVQGALRLRRLARAAGLAARARVRRDELGFRERQAFWIGDWERFAGRGAVADQVRFEREWKALRGYAAERGVRLFGDLPIYVARGQRRPRAPTRSCSTTAWWPACRPTPIPTPASSGATRSTTGRRSAPRATAGGSSGCGARSQLFDQLRIDHFRGFVAYWAVPAGARDARSGRWLRGPGRALFDAAVPRPGRAPADRRGPRRDHAGRRAAARRARAAGNGRAPVRLRAGRARQRTASSTTSRTGSSTPAPTTTTPRAAGTSRSTRSGGAAVRGARSPRHPRAAALVGADPPGLLLARPRGHGAGPGRARARQRGAHEHAGASAGRLAVAAAAGADAGAGAAVARGYRGGGALGLRCRVSGSGSFPRPDTRDPRPKAQRR